MPAAMLTTAAAPHATSASALTRSTSTWSMMAISPGWRRFVSLLVRRSILATPVTPGRSLPFLARRPGILLPGTFIKTILPEQTTWEAFHDRACPPCHTESPVSRRQPQQLLGMRSAQFGVFHAGEHPGQLAHPALVVERDHAAAHHAAVAGLLHHQVLVGEGGDLRQVGDDDHLGGAGQPGEPAPDLHRGLATHPGVDLVEDERGHRVGAGEHHLDG